MRRRPLLILPVLAILVSANACNRALLRIPTGASLPETRTGYSASHPLAQSLSVTAPIDLRKEHYGEKIAGTRWRACRTDALAEDEASSLIGQRLIQELRLSKRFENVDSGGNGDLQLRTEIHAFCAQAIGFIYLRVAGITAIRFQITRGKAVLYDKKLERVVTDADDEYTGGQVGTIEGAMLRTMADSLREVMKAFLSDLESHPIGSSGRPGAAAR